MTQMEKITIACPNGTIEVEGVRVGALAVTRYGTADWTITHLPTGASMVRAGACWPQYELEKAVDAAREIENLREDWINIDDVKKNKGEIMEICYKHGGFEPLSVGKTLEDFSPRLNGYGSNVAA